MNAANAGREDKPWWRSTTAQYLKRVWLSLSKERFLLSAEQSIWDVRMGFTVGHCNTDRFGWWGPRQWSEVQLCVYSSRTIEVLWSKDLAKNRETWEYKKWMWATPSPISNDKVVPVVRECFVNNRLLPFACFSDCLRWGEGLRGYFSPWGMY